MVNQRSILGVLALFLALGVMGRLNAQSESRFASEAEKDAWVKSHPEEYAKMRGKAATTASPETPSVKEAPAPVAKTPEVPVGYQPSLKDEQLPAVYQQASDIHNPAVRQRIEQDVKAGRVPKSNGTQTVQSAVANTPETVGGNLPADFPKFVNTGNPEADNAAYSKAKDAYYAAHDPETIALQQKVKLAQEEQAAYARRVAEDRRAEEQEMAAKRIHNQQ